MARSFANSQGHYIDCGASPLLAPGTAPFTVGAWVRRTTSSGAVRQIINRSKTGRARYALHLGASYAPTFLLNSDAGVTASVTGTSPLTLNAWVHVVGVRETSPAAQIRLYVDGAEVSSSPVAFAASRALAVFSSSFLIGRFADATDQDWDGDVAFAFFHNGHAATPAQVLALAHGLPPWLVLGSNLSACWPLAGVTSPEPDVMSALSGTLFGGAGGPSYAADRPALGPAARTPWGRPRGGGPLVGTPA